MAEPKKRKAAAPRKPSRPAKTARPVVDYPRQDERVTSSDYSVRIGAPESAASVEISIDQGDWRPCRQAVGYWWYDWSGYAVGEHLILVRATTGKARPVLSEAREFVVVVLG